MKTRLSAMVKRHSHSVSSHPLGNQAPSPSVMGPTGVILRLSLSPDILSRAYTGANVAETVVEAGALGVSTKLRTCGDITLEREQRR
jgi:hypothetical protein